MLSYQQSQLRGNDSYQSFEYDRKRSRNDSILFISHLCHWKTISFLLLFGIVITGIVLLFVYCEWKYGIITISCFILFLFIIFGMILIVKKLKKKRKEEYQQLLLFKDEEKNEIKKKMK